MPYSSGGEGGGAGWIQWQRPPSVVVPIEASSIRGRSGSGDLDPWRIRWRDMVGTSRCG